jgi:hypothetical protein
MVRCELGRTSASSTASLMMMEEMDSDGGKIDVNGLVHVVAGTEEAQGVPMMLM